MKKKAATLAAAVPAPSHLVTVTVPAWTPEQAEHIKKQVGQYFTGASVAIGANTAAPAPEPEKPAAERAAGDAIPAKRVEAMTETLIASDVPAGKVMPALGQLIEREGAPVAPFALGDVIRDEHSGHKVKVTAIDLAGKSFTVQNTDEQAPEGAREWPVPFDAAQYYEKISSGVDPRENAAGAATPDAAAPAASAAATSTSADNGAGSSSSETPRPPAPKKARGSAKAKPAHKPAAKKPAAKKRRR